MVEKIFILWNLGLRYENTFILDRIVLLKLYSCAEETKGEVRKKKKLLMI